MFISSEFFHPPLLSWFWRCVSAARIFPQATRAQWRSLPKAWRAGLAATGYTLLLSSVDALCGGGLSLALQEDGYWHPAHDQTANDFYQMGFGILCVLFLLWRFSKNFGAALITFVLLLGYVEDRIYYLLLPLFSPVFEWRNLPRVGLDFPEEVSGWIGWMARTFWGYKISLDGPQWFLLNVAALCVGAIVAIDASKRKDQGRNDEARQISCKCAR